MKAKILLPIIAVFIILVMGGYFLTHPSYEISLRAKYHYEMGEYKEAYSLAKEAFSIDTYNRMASTIMTQSQTSLKYVSYIEMGKKYIQEVDKIAQNDTITDAQKAKIKLICEIMKSAYIKLAPSVVTDQKLVQESAKYYTQFEKLYEKVNR